MTARPTPLPTSTVLQLTTITDWHIGAGHGIPGSADAVVRRDAADLPYVPGTTLTGLLRDACATVARALDGGDDHGPWQDWHRHAFGDPVDEAASSRRPPRPATVGFGPARIAAGLRASLAAEPRLAAATTTVRVGVAIDPESGRARDEALRFVEYARGGLPLTAPVTLPESPDADGATAVSALLVLGAAWCDRMGGDRRRGPGEVAMRFAGADAVGWAAWLRESGWTPPAVPEAPAGSGAATPMARSGGWTAVDLTVTAVGPLRVPAATAGNVVRGLDFLPGATLLPFLSDRWGAATVAAAVAGGALVVRHAHPQVDGRRGLPAPLTLFRPKTGGDHVSVGAPGEGERQVRDRWTVPDPAGPVPLQARATAQVGHNTVDRDRQRPTAAFGVHEVEVIPAGRVLAGRVLLDAALVARLTAEHGPDWASRLAGPARLGTRRRGEYGAADVAVSAPAALPDPAPPTAGFRLWLAGDAVVLDAGLRPGADPVDLQSALAALLGVDGLELGELTTRTRRRDGWQGRWGLPRESQVGLAAGSVIDVALPAGTVVDPAGWAELVHVGVGERRAEGFGEVVVDAPLLADGARPVRDQAPASAPAPVGGPDADGGHALVLAVLRGVVAREDIGAAVAAHRTAPHVVALRDALHRLSASQRGTWRAVTAAAAVTGDPARVAAHAAGWQQKKNPRRAEQRAVAERVAALLADGDGRIDRVLGTDLDPPERAVALAALVADLVHTAPEVTS